MIEILKDAKANDHITFHQWETMIRKRNGVFILRLNGIYDITDYLNRYDYLFQDENAKIASPIKFNAEIEVKSESKPVGIETFPYQIDCLWYKENDLFLAIEVCNKGSVEKNKKRIKTGKKFWCKKSDNCYRYCKIFMYNGEIKSWTEIWSFNRIFNMFENGQRFFKDFSKFKNYQWSKNIVEYI
ncbi:MAG: hypothetical protein LBB53_05840 [Prevotellaceae bacterium]|jgi:hypothetical protein|nr:hypothetical protein [Prevotellaceae bacterium]